MNKNQLSFVIEDEQNNKFGGYLSATINKTTNGGGSWIDNISDSNAFLFSLKSKGRLNGMMKFEIKNTSNTFLLWNSYDILFNFGSGHDISLLYKSNKTSSYCNQNSYDYHGQTNALCGGRNFTPKRFVVIQMK